MPGVANHTADNDNRSGVFPYNLVFPPARNFLNSTFTETPTAQAKEQRPRVRIHPATAAARGITAHARVRIGNARGSVLPQAELDDGQYPHTLVVEGILPPHAFGEQQCVNLLVVSDPV